MNARYTKAKMCVMDIEVHDNSTNTGCVYSRN